MTIVIGIIVIVIVAVVLGLALRQRTANDGVDSFRRQIDALSPEARKPTIEQVKSAERQPGQDAEGDDADNSA